MRIAVAIMAKAPVAGQVKTRLVPPLTPAAAADLARAFLIDSLDRLARVPGLEPWLALSRASPSLDGGAGPPVDLPAGTGLVDQGDGDLTERLIRVSAALFAAGADAVCLTNADSPTLPPGALMAARDALLPPGDRVVLGPAEDGGYWLIGLKALHPGLFQGISWSTERVLAETRARAKQLGLPVVLAPVAYDVDTAADLQRLRAELALDPTRAPATARWCARQDGADLA